MTAAPRCVRADVLGGDPLGRGDRLVVSWWLPEGASAQSAYRVVTDDGHDSGWVESDQQTYVDVPGPYTSRRSTDVRVRVRTDLGETSWSEPVVVRVGLLDASDWSASWIGVAEDVVAPKGERPAYWLRSTVDVLDPAGATLHVTALGLYEAFVNGARVGDVELAPGYTQYARRVQHQTYDVSRLLRPGVNVVAVLLADGWYRGQVGTPRAADQFGTTTALRVQLESGASTVLTTDASWRTAPSHVLRADLIGGQTEDRLLVDYRIHDAAYDDSAWSAAVRREVDVAVVPSIAPPVRRVEEIRPVSVTRLDDGASIVDLGQNINGWLRLRDLGPEGTTLTLRHGEHLDAAGDLTTAHLDVNIPIMPPMPLGQVDDVTSAGVEGDVFEPRFTTHGFQYARIEGHPDALAPDDVTGVVVHSDLRRTGWFECSDDRLTRLHEAVVWSLRDNVCGIPTDCPQRERAGWTGDWQVFASTAARLYDVNAFSRTWLRDVALDQREDGCVANHAPSVPVEGFAGPMAGLQGSAGWGDAVVSVPWDLYRATGDLSLLRETWGPASAWVDYAAGRAAGGRHPARVAARPDPAPHEIYLWDTGFHWGEWLEPGFEITDFGAFAGADKSEVATAYLHRSAAQLASIGQLIGADPAAIERYRTIADGARVAWRSEFVDDGRLVVQTQASHVRALAFGLVPDDQRPAVAARLAELVAEAGDHLATGFLSTGLLMPTLADTGHLDTAYTVLLQDSEPSWLTMIDRGATTVWERWNGVSADGTAYESLNHYSKGTVADFLHGYVGGLQPTSPGYRTFEVRPQPGGGLTWAHVRHDSPFGTIDVRWRTGAGRFVLDLEVPGATSAVVVLPDGTSHDALPGSRTFECAEV